MRNVKKIGVVIISGKDNIQSAIKNNLKLPANRFIMPS